MFLVNSRLDHFTAAPSSSGSKSLHQWGRPFFRSYGAILPSSLTRFHSSALGFSPSLPVSVCGTVTRAIHLEAFLGSVESGSWLVRRRASPLSSEYMGCRICLAAPPTIAAIHPIGCIPILLRPPIAQTRLWRCRNIDLLSITYAFRPRLRHRLTLGGLTFPRNP